MDVIPRGTLLVSHPKHHGDLGCNPNISGSWTGAARVVGCARGRGLVAGGAGIVGLDGFARHSVKTEGTPRLLAVL